MAGHNKWSKIKRKKGVNDAKRGALFTKLIREITVAARDGGGDPEYNARLRLAVDTSKANSMPAENIERAIKKGTGELEGVNYEETSYEGYGPGGVALFIECLTDNTNRTVADVRHALTKFDGSLGTDGSVAWQFDRKGVFTIDASRYSEDSVFEAAIDAGAEDVADDGDEFVVTAEPADFMGVQKRPQRGRDRDCFGRTHTHREERNGDNRQGCSEVAEAAALARRSRRRAKGAFQRAYRRGGSR